MQTNLENSIPKEIQIYIEECLKKIELEKNIKILYACESGSRAWGFDSPDSDYDVRFLFVHQKEKYLSVNSPLDSIDKFYDNDVDLSAWDIKKALGLLIKSNATPFEWLQSPILYRKNEETEKFRNQLWLLSKDYFSAKTLIFHYLGIAKGMLSKIENNQISIKKYFYVLRPVLAAYYIKTRNEAAPMEFKFLVENLNNNNSHKSVKEAIENLWEQKMIAKEGDKIEVPTFIHSFIETQISECGTYASNLKRKEKDVEPLNEFFRRLF
jgi:hypothetical protein